MGASRSYGRDVALAHYKACLQAGIQIKSFNSEEHPSKWKYEIGPLNGYHAIDQLWISRYILHRVAETFGLVASLESKVTEKDQTLKRNGALIKFNSRKTLKNKDNIW